jgi:hypothetical protein
VILATRVSADPTSPASAKQPRSSGSVDAASLLEQLVVGREH